MKPVFPARRTVAGFVAAPLAVGLATGLGGSLVLKFDLFPVVVAAATALATMATLLLGVPTHVLLHALQMTGRRVYLFYGALLGAVVALTVAGLAGALDPALFVRLAAGYSPVCTPLGLFAAWVFWSIARPDRRAAPVEERG